MLASCSLDLARVGKVSETVLSKISTSKLMLQRLPIAFGIVKIFNTSENLLNEIRQIIYSFYCAKDI